VEARDEVRKLRAGRNIDLEHELAIGLAQPNGSDLGQKRRHVPSLSPTRLPGIGVSYRATEPIGRRACRRGLSL
jgi:hypothetical protein